MSELKLIARAEAWDLKAPVRIARQTYYAMEVIVAELSDQNGVTGRGEAAGLPYEGETIEGMLQQLREMTPLLGQTIKPADLLRLMPRGGARNALDCALWDLRCKQAGRRIWALFGEDDMQPRQTALTFGIMESDAIYNAVDAVRHMPIIKLKVDREHHLANVEAAREAHPAARILIDANGSWDRDLLDALAGPLHKLGVELIEQPVPVGEDGTLEGYAGPVRLAADESCTDSSSLTGLRGLYDFVNIKLDKTGGLTEALSLAGLARQAGFGLMAGNMGGTSLAMAPHFVIGQKCTYVDLDAPLLCQQDREHALIYEGPMVQPPSRQLWG
ncbi:dipeptide epimerase [Henriciella sp.]|uniref:dipeptide epimerase n=1 Tax=Henriciella sp. TaxID=1968823 RepID=UPI0026087E14|nr:dipeptide epimerase [Henriciella sp.]